jgi:hypothetical protein
MSNHRVPTTFGYSLGFVGLLCFVTLLQGSIAQADATFSTPTNLSLTTQDSSDQQVASSGSYVYLVWRDNPSAVFNPEILMMRSSDGGRTFAPWENLSLTPYTSSAPWVAASGEHVYVIWSETRSVAPDTDGYYMRHSSDFGATFGPKSNLTTALGVPTSANCAMAASGSNVYLSCTQAVGGYNEIVVARSNDNGTTFPPTQNVSQSPVVGSVRSRIAASGSHVYVAWEEDAGSASEIFMASSIDNGVNFGTPTNMSMTTGFSSISVALDADGNNVWLAWSDRSLGNDEIFYRRSADGGATFSGAENLSATPLTGSSTPFVKGKGNQVWVAWTDPNPAGTLPDVYVRSSSDAGTTFGDTLNISNSATINSNQPRIGLTDLAVSLFWGEPASFREVYYSYQELTVSVPPPALLSLSPGAGMQTQSVDVDLVGSGFQSGSTLALSGTGVTVTDVAFVSPTGMKAKMNVSLTATPGGRDLTVTNPDGQSSTLSGAFTVMSASALMLIEITRTDVNTGAGNGSVLASSSDSSNSNFKSLLSHLENAERALLRQPADLATAINQMDAFYIKIGNMAKGKKPEITSALYMTLYTDYAMVMGSLGGTVKPA